MLWAGTGEPLRLLRESPKWSRFPCTATVVVALLLWAAPIRAQDQEFDLLTASVSEVQKAVAAGAVTYERIVQLYLSRIDAYDKNGPHLNAVIQINPRALEIARFLDQERRTKGLRSPLHGIPVAVKDNIDVVDIPSAGGNLAFSGTYPAMDATVVRKLRDAGAIIFLKTNMDELALGSQGLSSLGGQILNPYDLKRNPGGSSGGSGVAVNVGFAALSVVTETGFSIRSPASNNSIVGIAPTEGLVSRAGVIPISFTQDRVGVHAKSVADAAVLLTWLRGFDPDDLTTAESLGKLDKRPYVEYLDQDLTGSRIGVLRDLFRKGQEFEPANKVIEREITSMQEHRAVVVDGLSTGLDLIALIPDLRVNNYELRFDFDAYLHRRGPSSPVKSLSELVASGKYLKDLDSRYQQAMKVDVLDFDQQYLARLANRRMLRQLLVELMDRYRLDALVYPVKSLAAPMIGNGDHGIRDNPISAVTGLPAIAIPAGVDEMGLPLALELLGRPFSEPRLIHLAYAYEQASHRRVMPKTTPHLPGEVIRY
jgi:Asp-tRNA(Asn)/Glu-tRNA(Gln) amidotransferase A subunit family amidase